MAVYQDNKQLLMRMRWLRRVIALVFLLMAARLWHLAVLESTRYQELAGRNQLRTVPLLAPRGLIRDREGRVIVDNAVGISVFLYRDEVQNMASTRSYLVEGLRLDPELVDERLYAAQRVPAFQPVLLKDHLSLEEISYLFSHQTEHPEFRIYEQPRRHYRFGELAAHSMGYVGEISEKQLGDPHFPGRKPGDIIGKAGLELALDPFLSGTNGARKFIVNSVGKLVEEIDRIEPISGKDVTVTLDLDLQWVAERELGENTGAAVVIDPRNGEILALASKPAFDPNLFASRITAAQWSALIESPDDPLQNRALQNAFSPGSIFKLVMAVAGLEDGVVDAESSVYCNGAVVLYGHPFRCWKAGGHGRVRLHEAIRQSCNVYFYLLGQKLGIDRIEFFSRRLGLGRITGVDLGGEVAGLVPSETWKRQVFGEKWHAGETISVSIGQGPLNVTPIQLAQAIGVLATGKFPEVHLLREGPAESMPERKAPQSVSFSEETIRLIRAAMWSVVNEGGTGRSARVADFDVCGKTGTVQTISNQTREKLSKEARKQFEPNAWFVGFAPKDDPELVVIVLVQRGGGGGAAAAPIAGKIFEAYYQKRTGDGQRHMELAMNR